MLLGRHGERSEAIHFLIVIPAQAGIHVGPVAPVMAWIPAFAGMTDRKMNFRVGWNYPANAEASS